MTASQTDATNDPQTVIASLQQKLDEGLAREAALAEELAARDATFALHKTEFDERIEYQAATVDILTTMSASPGDAQPALDLIVRHATELCNVPSATLFEYDGELVHIRSDYRSETILAPSALATYIQLFPMHPARGSISCRAILDRQIIHIRDLRLDPELADFARELGHRSQVSVPLIRDDLAIGVITIGAQAAGGFSDRQIELLKTFAKQAVIAITSAETYRALQERTVALAQRNTEYGERIEHQSATIDVLKAMSASPGDPQPVFDLIVDRARDLCDAYGATVFEFDGTEIHWRAATGVSDDPAVRAAYEAQFPMVPTRGWAFGRAILDRRIIRIDDMEAEPGLDPTLRGITAKSNVTTPIMRGDEVIGAIGMGSREKGGFSDSQVELLKTFAEQAAIAITSAETYRALQTRTADLQETLEYQTATSDVLKVISRTTFDLQPVLTMVAEIAVRLCLADQAAIYRCEGDSFQLVTNFGWPPEYEARQREVGWYLVRANSPGIPHQVIIKRRAIHIHDVTTVPEYPEVAIKLGKERTGLGVPLLREGEPVGVIVLARQRVEPFTDRQIDLVSTFADQAVIAIENTRLLTEQQEALERQTATAEVLQVINTSPGDLTPVFDAVLEKAMRLCGAAFGSLYTYDGERFHSAAQRGVPPAYAAFRAENPPLMTPGGGPATLLETRRPLQVLDLRAHETNRPDWPAVQAMVELGGIRTILTVPLLKDEAFLGYISIFRQEVRAFSDKQIALLENFAAQAVIAMENARLLTEQREALEQQTATAEVLQVINANPGDLAPVFDGIMDKAHTLCGAVIGSLVLFDGTHFRAVATHGFPEQVASLMRHPVPPNSRTQELIGGVRFRQIEDIRAIWINPDYLIMRALVEYTDVRTALFVPLRKDGALLGFISAYRPEVRAFSDKEVALLENFAAQAVIAMENARLLGELRQRTADLQETLEYQTATSDVLSVISRSTFDLEPVLNTLVETAARLCVAEAAHIVTRDGRAYRVAATFGHNPETDAFVRGLLFSPGRDTVVGRVLLDGQVVHLEDNTVDPEYDVPGAVLRGAYTQLGVPLLREGDPIGVIVLVRFRVEPFTNRQIELVGTFADQAVIAIENTRLITEQREALAQQTATAEILQVINASPGDLAPVFTTMLQKALDLCEAAFGGLFIRDGEQFYAAATAGLSPEFSDFIRKPFVPAPDSSFRQAIRGESIIHIPDVSQVSIANNPQRKALVEQGGARTQLLIALSKDDEVLGALNIFRQEVRPFSSKQIALLKNFAAQAVIAMENARLLTEQREALEQQTATAEVLQVINASPGDLAPVFDAMLEKALHLCDAAFGNLWSYDGEVGRLAAICGASPEYRAELMRAGPQKPEPGGSLIRLVEGESLVHIADITAEGVHRSGAAVRRMLADRAGARTVLWVPMRKDGVLLGFFTIYRTEVRPFAAKQIALLQNFAAQAVIAMENARLLDELRQRTADLQESLEYQTATSDVLKVISRSTFDLQPVLAMVAETAARLCVADQAAIYLVQDDMVRLGTNFGFPPEYEAWMNEILPLPVGVGTAAQTVSHRAIIERSVIHIPDVATVPCYPDAPIRLGRQRTSLGVPLLREGEPVGLILLARQRVEPFTDRQIELVSTFADQAVIAMENARLINEQREALEQQTATAEVLQVINTSPGDLAPVFDAMLEKAMRLCGVAFGMMTTFDGERFHPIVWRGLPAALSAYFAEGGGPSVSSGMHARLVAGAALAHVVSMKDEEAYRSGYAARRALVDLGGAQTGLAIALRKDDALLGTFMLYRQEIRPFTDKQIALLQNFAAQAVIAMENARLLDEIRQRQAELRTTFDNMGDGVAMFDADLRLAAWNRNFQQIIDLPDALLRERPRYADYMRLLAERGEFGATGIEAELRHRIDDTDQELRLERVRPDGRVIEVRRNAVSGGGFVLIYSDITEQKRSEEQILAARDAAETALRELRTAQANLIQAEKMASLGQLTAGIAHEIKNPLNFVNNFASLSVDLLAELKDTAAPGFAALTERQRAEVEDVSAMLTSNLEKITEHGKRADGIVKAMLEHSRGSSAELRMVDLNTLIDEALNLAYHGARGQDQSFNITLERDFGEGIDSIEVNPQDITRVFLNIFSNGFYAATRRACAGGDPGFVPTLKVTTIDAGEAVEIRVRDNGTGIPAGIRDKLFQPFFTTKPTGEGTGLGLSITYDIVTQQHGGSIAVDSKVGDYSEFTVRLPRGIRANEGGRA